MVIASAIRRAAATSKARGKAPLKQGKAYSGSRIEIVSPKLCDDILQRLRHTLPPPGTCDLLDINPGGPAWSQKLHNVLQPRRHIIVDPEPEKLRTFFPGYGFAATLEEAVDPARDLLTPELREKAQSEAQYDESGLARNLNKHLLITANFTASAIRTSHFVGASATFNLHNFYNDLIQPSSAYHKYGHGRLLAWIDDEQREAIMPQSVVNRSRTSVILEASMHLTEWACGSNLHHLQRRRPYNVDVENMIAVKEKEGALKIPDVPERHPALPPKPLWFDDFTMADVERLSEQNMQLKRRNKLDWVDKLVTLDKQLKAQNEELRNQAWEGAMNGGRPSGLTAEYKDLRSQAGYAVRTLRNSQKIRKLALSQRQVESECRSLRTSADPSTFKQQNEKLKIRLTEIHDTVNGLSGDNKLAFRKTMDEYRAYDSNPRTMAYSSRAFEPLLTHTDEFRPQKAMSLLDLTPNPVFLDTMDTVSKRTCFLFVTMKLFTKPARSIPEALSTIVPAGLEDFVATVPSLNDPGKIMGMHLDDVRIRSLSAEVLMNIALAYEKWPFRPKTNQLNHATIESLPVAE